jgi:catechol 2,3-dioxygenase-like lactoylglutathione lyase family enzyme
MMQRPFKVVGVGPVSLFVGDLAKASHFYSEILGFKPRTTAEWHGHKAEFFSIGSEHHSLALYDVGLRTELGLPPRLGSMALGARVANYRQLRAAVSALVARGAQEVAVPPELVPGFDYVAHLRDPDGNLVQLYYYQRQCAPAGADPQPVSGDADRWPEAAEAPNDVYGGEQFLGPWE